MKDSEQIYIKIKKIFLSCENIAQLNSCYQMIERYDKMFGNQLVTSWLKNCFEKKYKQLSIWEEQREDLIVQNLH